MSCKKGVFCIVNISLSHSITMLPCVSDYSTFPLMICTLHIAYNVITSRRVFSFVLSLCNILRLSSFCLPLFSRAIHFKVYIIYQCVPVHVHLDSLKWHLLFFYISLFQFCLSFRMCSCFVEISTFLWIFRWVWLLALYKFAHSFCVYVECECDLQVHTIRKLNAKMILQKAICWLVSVVPVSVFVCDLPSSA